VSGLRHSDPPAAALQQHNCGTQQIASAKVRAYCVWTIMHEWVAAAFVRRSESPFFPAARFGPTSMRKPLSRPEPEYCGTSQTSIRRHPPRRSAMREYAVAPIQYRGVAMRHVGPRDATWVPLPISTWTGSSPLGLCAPDRSRGGNQQRRIKTTINLYEQFYGRKREASLGCRQTGLLPWQSENLV
jgi:hypothetical protein